MPVRRSAKRPRQDASHIGPSVTTRLASSRRNNHPGLCLLPLLQPVRLCLHPFLSDDDAARLMRASRSVTTLLLSGFSFAEHVFTPRCIADVKRAVAVYERYNMRILRICAIGAWSGPLIDRKSGRSVFPASLLALTFGWMEIHSDNVDRWPHAANAAFDSRPGEACGEEVSSGRPSEFNRLMGAVRVIARGNENDRSWDVMQYRGYGGATYMSLPPGSLPPGLRFLQINDSYVLPLQVGSIPDSVAFLQLGRDFNRPLAVGHLPASLTHLVLSFSSDSRPWGGCFSQPLLPGVLPAGLRRLRVGPSWNHYLLPGALPLQLVELSLGSAFNLPIHPGVIPASVRRIRLSDAFDQPLQVGSIPHGVTHLQLGLRYDQPLPPGVLPATLRELAISQSFSQPLQVGSLPDGLVALAFHIHAAYQHVLQPGIIPASVQALDMGGSYRQQLVAGGIPATVRWVMLPLRYSRHGRDSMLAPSTKIAAWWDD